MQGAPLLTDDAQEDPTAGIEQPGPLITGKTEYLWSGAGAVALILIVMLVLLGRWRAGRRVRQSEIPSDFFQPAGEDAEITFDDGAHASTQLEADQFFPDAPAGEEPPRPSLFSKLFGGGKKHRIEPEPADTFFEEPSDDPSFASVEIEREPDDHFAPPRHGGEPAVDWSTIEREARLRADEETARAEAEEERRRDEAEAQARWRAVEDERRRRLADEERRRAERDAASEARTYSTPAPIHDEVSRTLAEVEEALQVQREAIQAETQSLLDSFASRFSERLDSLSASVEHRLPARSPELAAGARDDSALVREIIRRLDDHRTDVNTALSTLARRIEQVAASSGDATALRAEVADVKRALNGGSGPSAPTVQLSEIIRDALAPGGYEFDALLANNRRADCLIRLSRPPGPIAIDARFPIEAFHALHERRSEGAENEFRRIALRHIVNVAERLIAPGFTADSAILFLPAESLAAEIHSRFPDVVQDAYRARVWIVSPTTLMATLHTLSAFLRDAPKREEPPAAEAYARRALEEVGRLNERIEMIEKRSADRRNFSDYRSANDATDWSAPPARPSQDRSEPSGGDPTPDDEPSGGNGHLYDDEDSAVADNSPTQQRPLFPLR